MTPPTPDGPLTRYRFADLTLDVARRSVTCQAQPIELKALDFDLLRFLVEQAPNVVNADVLAEKVWGRHFVSPENVAQRVMLLRQSLSDDANRPRYIETVRNRGYRLVPAVERALTAAPHRSAGRRSLVTATAAALLGAVGLTAAAAYWLGSTEEQPTNPGSVAVLPFEDLSPDHDDAYFAVGMQDEIVNQLTKISGLRVFPVPPSGAQRSIPDLGRELNVATVLRGSVQYAGGRVRVSTHLSHTASGQNLWSESYEHDLSDIFRIQSDIALELARALRVELSPAERARVERVPTTVPQARDLYLLARGRDPLSAEVLIAMTEVEQAVVLDPEFIEAWAFDSYFRNYAQFIDPARSIEHRLQSEHAAHRALELDPEFGLAHNVLGWLLATKKDWTGAEAAFRRAADLNVPSGSLGSYAWLQLDAGKFGAQARDIFEDARAADPQNALYYRSLAFVHEGLGESTRANELYASALTLLSGDSLERRALLSQRMHWLLGRNRLAEAAAIGSADPLNTAMLASLDSPEPALEQLHREYEATVDGNPNRRRDIGLWAGVFGDPVLALEAMSASIREQGGLMPYVWLPQLAHMRRLPEFKVFMRDIGMVAYWQEYGWPPFCQGIDQHDFECY
jgi:TolB-like protein/DNA-binding winged helix-turn-helix (wHTH) protein